MTIRCAIIDDEPLAGGLLESYVEKTPCLELIGTYTSALAAMRDLRDDPAQLIFLDIQMPELSGIEFTKILPSETKVVLTTAFPQYALEGFKVNAIDYLLKPISYEAFFNSVEKVLSWFGVSLREEPIFHDRLLYIKSDYKLQRIYLDDIIYVEGLKDYLRFHLKDGETVTSLMSMRKVEDYLPHPEFLRTHRSFIVKMSEVRAIDRLRIVIDDDVYVPISENYREMIMRYLDSHTIS